MASSSFIVYQEYEKYLQFLTDEEAGRLLKALFAFNAGEVVDIENPTVGIAYTAITSQMTRDKEKYEKRVQANRDNGKKGGRPPKEERKENNSAKPSETQDNPAKPNDNPTKPLMSNESCVMSNESWIMSNEKDINPKTVQAELEPADGGKAQSAAKKNIQEDRFNAWWVEYPKKVGKQAARKAWRKITPDKQLFKQILDATKAQARTDQWRKNNGQFIPNPATWLNQGRWDDELAALNTGSGGPSFRVPNNRDFMDHYAEDYDALEE